MNYVDIHTYGDVMVTSTERRKPKSSGFVLPSIEMLAIAGIVASTAVAFLFFTLYRSTAHEYAQYKADVSAAQEAIRLDNERKFQRLTEVNKALGSDYDKARADLARLRSSGGVIRVQPNRCTGILPTDKTSSPGIDATAAERTVSAEQCEAIANNAVFDAQTLMFLQKWILDVHEASK